MLNRALCPRSPSRSSQGGVFLIEAMVAIVIFSVGILAMIGLQALSVSAQSDAQYRIEAANEIDQLVGRIWAGVDRRTIANVPLANFATSLVSFQHNGTTTGTCTFSGGASANPIVTNWIDGVNLPEPSGKTKIDQTQVLVDTANFNRVTITVCWQAPNDKEVHHHTVTAYIS